MRRAILVGLLVAGALAVPATSEAKTILYEGSYSGETPGSRYFSFKLVKRGDRQTVTDVNTSGIDEFCYDSTGYAFDWGHSMWDPRAKVVKRGRFAGWSYRPTGDPNRTYLDYVRGSFSPDGKTASGQFAYATRSGSENTPGWYADCSTGFLDFSVERIGSVDTKLERAPAPTLPKAPVPTPSKVGAKTTTSYAGKVVDDGYSGFSFDIVERRGKRSIENVRLDGPATIWCDDENDFRNGAASPYLKPRVGDDGRFRGGVFREDSFNTRFDYIQGELSQHGKLATGVFALIARWSDSGGNAYACTSGLSYWRADRISP